MLVRSLLTLLLALCALLPPAVVHAGGFTLTSFGGRRGGMLSNLGRPDEPTALVHNPAGLADQPGVQFYLYGAPAFMDLELEMKAQDPELYPEITWPVGSDGYYEQAIAPDRSFGVLPYLGMSTDLGFITPVLRNLVVSAAVYAPNFYGAYFPEGAPSAYNFVDGMFLVGAVTVGAGYRINRHVAVGNYLSYHYMRLSMAQRMSVVDALTPPGETPSIQTRTIQGMVGDLRMDFAGEDHGVGFGWGVLVTPVHWFGLGISYSIATAPRFDGDVDFRTVGQQAPDPERLRELVGAVNYKLPRQLSIEMVIPPAVSFGVMVNPAHWIEIGFDVRLWLYNLYEAQVITPHYSDDDQGKEVISAADLTRDKQYSPSYQITLGALLRPFEALPGMDLMLGGGYDHSPIPDETFTLDNPSLSHIKATVGARWQIDPRWRVSLTYLLVIYLPRDITTSQTSPPTNVRGWGMSHSPALAVTCTL